MDKKRKPLSYEIEYARAAEKFFKSHEDVRTQYKEALKELLNGEHPEKVDVKQIKGKRTTYFRIKLGGYRVLYTLINNKVVVINTILAGPRGDVYKKMHGLK